MDGFNRHGWFSGRQIGSEVAGGGGGREGSVGCLTKRDDNSERRGERGVVGGGAAKEGLS